MGIRQFQIAYEPVADRLLLRVSTRRGEEYLVHLTRRLVGGLGPELVAASRRETGEASTASTGPGFEQRYRSPANVTHPLGREPLLVAEFTLEPAGDSNLRMTLRERRARSITLTLTEHLVQAFCALLREAVASARWGIELDHPATESAMAIQLTAKTLH